MGVPQNGWVCEGQSQSRMDDDLRGTPHLWTPPIYNITELIKVTGGDGPIRKMCTVTPWLSWPKTRKSKVDL